jgi:hypothetical protein
MNCRLLILFATLQFNVLLPGQKTIPVIVYHAMDGDTITASNKNQIIKEKYEVLKGRQKVKHGSYQRFSKLMEIVEKGTYTNGQKTGVWTHYLENGMVAERFDHDRDSTLEPLIFTSRIFTYPPGYLVNWREKGISPPQGEVLLVIAFDENCELTRCEIETSSVEILNAAVLSEFGEYTRLRKKYGLPVTECLQQKTHFKVKFDNN